MGAPKGHKKYGGGRKKGQPNHTTASVKAALSEAFDKLGGVASLVEWGKKNPALFYPLWARMLPTEIKSADGAPVVLHIVKKVVTSASSSREPAGRDAGNRPAPSPA